MKMLDKVKEILDKYDLDLNLKDECEGDIYRDLEKCSKLKVFDCEKGDGYLMRKYHEHVPVGWYGFALGRPTPCVWIDALEEVLDLLIEADSDFKIHQIKTKFGGVRFYVESAIIEDLFQIELEIERRMFDEMLIY